MDVSIHEHDGPKVPCSKGLLCREVTSKVTPTNTTVTCYKDINDFHLIHI